MTKHTFPAAGTMRDALQDLPGLGYAESFAKNVRAALRKCPRVYQKELHEISADSIEFEARWGTGRIRHVPKGFKDGAQFRTWRKNVRMVLARRQGVVRSPSLLPGWAQVMTAVRDSQGKVLGSNANLTIGVLAREASRAGLSTKSVAGSWIDETAARLENNLRKSFIRGIRGYNRMIERRRDLPAVDDLLPEAPLPAPTPLRPAANLWRRSACNPDADRVWSDFANIMHIKQYGEEGPQIEGTPTEFQDSSVKAYENSLNWLLAQLAAEDLLEAGMDLAEVITHPNLVAATNHWIQRRKGRGLPADRSSIHAHVTRMVHLGVKYLDLPPKEVMRLKDLRRKPAIRTASVGAMSAARERWIRDFAADPALQLRAHRLPETLMTRSKAILDRLDKGSKVRPGEVMLALRLGVAALAVGILFRASPVRSTNLRTLRMRGQDAEFDLEAFREDPRLKEVRLVIPGAQVKNGEDIDEVCDDDLAPVLRWYLSEIRPRLISSHPFGKNHVDSDYLFPSTSHAPMERSMFPETFRRACTEVGFEMEMHQARHVCAYWILSVDPNAWGEAAAVLHIDEMTVRKYYGWLDRKKASAAGRQKLKESRAFTRRHRQGVLEAPE